MSHTPGPWVILDLREKGDECITIASSATPQALCRVRNEVTGLPLNKEDVANARLIAAAPDLLEACEALLQINNEREPFTYAGMWEWKKRKYEAEQKARTAIAKARGEA